jgi:mRNA interferase MazF
MTFGFGDIVLLTFPFSDQQNAKRRPGLVLAYDAYGDLLVARITSKVAEFPTDVLLKDWAGSGLNIASTVRLLKLATAHESFTMHKIGALSSADRAMVVIALKNFVHSLEAG